MLRLHHALRANHHLRHGGRMQYGLFLKGVGLTLEQSLAFWKSEFTKKMDADKVCCRRHSPWSRDVKKKALALQIGLLSAVAV